MKATAPEMLRAAGWLALFAAVATTLLAGTHALTREQIAAATEARLLRELSAVLPPSAYDNALTAETFEIDDPALGGRSTVYRARKGAESVAVIVTVRAPDGYSGPIDLLVGVDRSGQLTGVRVTAHRETPGLGDKIDTRKSDWILGFTGRSLDDPPRERWTVRKDGGAFDQFTGATITARAVVRAVARTLELVTERPALFFPTPETEAPP